MQRRHRSDGWAGATGVRDAPTRSLHIAPALLAAVALLACSPRLEWRELRSADGYSVLLPGRAQVVARDVTFEGQRLPMSMTSTGTGASMFAVGVAKLPPALADDAAARERLIAYFRDALVKNIGATSFEPDRAALARPPAAPHALRAAQGIRAQGVAKRADGAGQDGTAARLAARWFIVDDRLYQLTALGGDGAIDAVALETFFDSFSPMSSVSTDGAGPASGAK